MNFFKRKYYQWVLKFLKNSDQDIKYAKKQYYYKTQQNLDLNHPKEFTEKIQWLKLFKYTESYQKFVDKYAVREYIEEKVGNKYLNKLYGVYKSPEEISLNKLPKKFVLKGTHGSGYNIIVNDKAQLDWDKTKQTLQKFLDKNQYKRCREKIYKNVPRRIIAEKFLENSNQQPLLDYKFYCFEGSPKYILVKDEHDKCFYDLYWNKIESTHTHNYLRKEIPKPTKLSEMISIAEKLSAGFHFLRVDLYLVDNEIYFGELTFFPNGGIERLQPEYLNKEFGDLIKLSSQK